VGGEAKVPAAIEQHKLALQATRTLKLGKIAPVAGTADFFVVIASSAAGAQIEAAKFISGEEKLKPLTENLRHAKIDFAFPDNEPTKILRRGTLSCSDSHSSDSHSKDSGECNFVMTLPEDVHSVD
jgi:hypothetical protein